jgi:hypothetical protein
MFAHEHLPQSLWNRLCQLFQVGNRQRPRSHRRPAANHPLPPRITEDQGTGVRRRSGCRRVRLAARYTRASVAAIAQWATRCFMASMNLPMRK